MSTLVGRLPVRSPEDTTFGGLNEGRKKKEENTVANPPFLSIVLKLCQIGSSSVSMLGPNQKAICRCVFGPFVNATISGLT